MTSIRHRPVRIIAHENDRPEPVHSRRTRPNYVSLARRDKLARTQEYTFHIPHNDRFVAGLTLSISSGHDDDSGNDDESENSEDGTDATSSIVRKRLRNALQPVVAKMLRTQNKVLDLVCKLAQEIAAFCGDRSINETGVWDAQLPLDADLLQDTTLNLTLSYSTLSLRFDTSDDETRQLLLTHASMLERELGTLMHAWDAPRQIQITVW
ncbi:type III secretion system protein SctP [Mycetohabitans sp. B2]|uniref:type III secretion system protein SctP n=1 Tax=Mycetohabitans sp. B2 TaxID=2841274 RepID=UPI001F219E15|nr:type III secretion system protein SctP [Mycetohabitans sp. B2]MCF7697517.1 type III secretion system protein SctP [Mycetohabitans sp. B2]